MEVEEGGGDRRADDLALSIINRAGALDVRNDGAADEGPVVGGIREKLARCSDSEMCRVRICWCRGELFDGFSVDCLFFPF